MVRRGAGDRAAELADLDGQERRARARSRGGEHRVDRLVRQVAQEPGVAGAGDRVLGVHVKVAERRHGHRGHRVQLGTEVADRLEHRGALGLVAEVDRLDHHERAAAHRLGDLLERRHVEDAADGGHLVGQRRDDAAPRLQDLLGTLLREHEHARVHLAQGMEAELDRGHHAEVAAAAAQRPEQVGIVVAVDPTEVAVGRHDLDRGHLVRLEAVLAAEPAEAAAQGIAGDADVGRGAGERGEPVLGGGLDGLDPDRAGADAGDARDGVDLDVLQPVHLHEHGVGQRVLHGGRVVAGALRGHLQAAVTCEADDLDDVMRGGGDGDSGGPLVDREVPGRPGLVPVRVVGADDLSLDPMPQALDLYRDYVDCLDGVLHFEGSCFDLEQASSAKAAVPLRPAGESRCGYPYA